MGMYDYVGTEGEQVKCFYVPCINIAVNEKTGEKRASLHAMGGLLRGFDEVPYMTPYYNYGKDFCIVEYRWEDVPYIHVIRDARFEETIDIADIPDNFNLTPVMIDNYGVKLNITSVKELKEFIQDYHEKKELSYLMEVQYLSDYGLDYKLDFDRMRKLNSAELDAESKIRDAVGKKVYEKTMKLFNDRWFIPDEENFCYFGLTIADYIEMEVIGNPDREPRVDDDWSVIFETAYELLSSNYENPLNAYFDWCDKQGIVVDKDFVRSLFEKFTKYEV